MATALEIVRSFYPKVKKVVNASRNLTVQVTKKDAELSQTEDHTRCMMALACKRHLPIDGAVISTSTAYLIKGRLATRYTVPPGARTEIVSFDRGAGFAPGTYTLSKPQKPGPARARDKGRARWTGARTRYRNHASLGVRRALSSVLRKGEDTLPKSAPLPYRKLGTPGIRRALSRAL